MDQSDTQERRVSKSVISQLNTDNTTEVCVFSRVICSSGINKMNYDPLQ